MFAVTRWNDRARAHHLQSQRAQVAAGWSAGDTWGDQAELFRADPHRIGDAVLDRLAQAVSPTTTILDVGGGAGRYAVPLALRGWEVTVVEPDANMVAQLADAAAEAGITNLVTLQGGWGSVEARSADVALCVNVIHDTDDVAPFIRALDDHARTQVLVVASMDSPLVPFSPFWESVHGERRIDPPGVPELLPVLWELGIFADLHTFPPDPPETVPTRAAALSVLRHFLYVTPATELDQRLQAAMRDLLVETPAGFGVRGAAPRRQALLSWQPCLGGASQPSGTDS